MFNVVRASKIYFDNFQNVGLWTFGSDFRKLSDHHSQNIDYRTAERGKLSDYQGWLKKYRLPSWVILTLRLFGVADA
jgi:hypothetical protein